MSYIATEFVCDLTKFLSFWGLSQSIPTWGSSPEPHWRLYPLLPLKRHLKSRLW